MLDDIGIVKSINLFKKPVPKAAGITDNVLIAGECIQIISVEVVANVTLKYRQVLAGNLLFLDETMFDLHISRKLVIPRKLFPLLP